MRLLTRAWRLASQWQLPALLLYLAMAVVFFASAWFGPAGTYVGGPGDPQGHMWYFRWIPWALTHGRNPLVSTYLGWPTGFSVMWNNSDGAPLLPILLWPVTTLFGVFVTYNVLATLGLTLSAWTAYLLNRRFVASGPAAFVGALPFGFGSYMAGHQGGHAALCFLPFVPLIFLALYELIVRRRLRPWVAGALLGLVTAAQFLVTEELVATAGLFAAVAVVILALQHRDRIRDTIPPVLVGGAVAVLVFGVIVAAPLYVQFFGPGTIKGLVRPPNIYVTDLLNFVLPGPVQLVRFAPTDPIVARFTGNASESNGYIGIGLLGILVYTAVRYRRRKVVVWASLVALIIALASMGPRLHVGGTDTGIPLLWRASRLPLLQHVLPGRMMLFFYLFAGILLSVFVESVARSARPLARVAGLAAIAFALVLLLPYWPYFHGTTPVPAYFTSGAVDRELAQGDVALVAPYAGAFNYDAMVWQAIADFRFRIPEGNYLGPDATGHAVVGPPPTLMSSTLDGLYVGNAVPPLDDASRAQLFDYLESRNVKLVVVGPMPNRDRTLAFFTSLLGRPPVDEGGVSTWRAPFR